MDSEYYSSGSWVEFKWNLSIIQVEGPSVLSMRFGGSGEDLLQSYIISTWWWVWESLGPLVEGGLGGGLRVRQTLDWK